MTWLKRILIGLGAVFLLLIALVFVAGYWGSTGPATQTLSMTVGDRTVTVGGHYKNMTQESQPDGIKVVVDGHVISVNADHLTVDDKMQMLEPGQNVDIFVDEAGALAVKIVGADAGTAQAPQ